MRKLYTSPRQANIDRVVALMDARGIATRVTNRSRYDHTTWKRYSYVGRFERRAEWPEVWIVHADDYKAAHLAFRELGLEPFIARAPEEVVAEQKTRLADEKTRRQRLVDALATLGGAS